MTVKELIEKIKDYPDAVVAISMDSVYTDECYIASKSDKMIMIAEE